MSIEDYNKLRSSLIELYTESDYEAVATNYLRYKLDKYVKIRTNRHCCRCSGVSKAGSQMYTGRLLEYGRPVRFYLCESCAKYIYDYWRDDYKELDEAESLYPNIVVEDW